MHRLQVGFAGTPEFAATALAAVLAAGFRIPIALTQPDRPRGRGLALAHSPVKVLCLAHGIPVVQPASFKTEAASAGVLAVPVDVLVVAAYGLILPRAVLAWPPRGSLNIHASLLPRWRGAAPIQRALLAGDAATGVSIMQMDEGLDTGPVVARYPVPIGAHDTFGTLHDALARTGADAIVAALSELESKRSLSAEPQPDDGVTYAAKVTPEEAAIQWQAPARTLDRALRAYDPVPGAFTYDPLGERLKLFDPEVLGSTSDAPPGTVTMVAEAGIDIACGDGGLRVRTVQPAGGKRMPAAAYARGRGVIRGARFAGVPAAASPGGTGEKR